MSPSLTRRLARLVRERPVERGDRVAAERYVRDALGSLVAGAAAPDGRVLRAYGAAARDAEGRAFLRAALTHVTETDDLHRASVTHPGCVVVPVAWTLAADAGAGGHAFLDAVLAGYEAMLRVGESLGPGHYRVFHNTATAGVFGAAAAASRLLGLDEDRWVWALGNAGTQAAGLWQFNEEGAGSKPLHAGHAAAAGLRAALLARAGMTGPEAILEGEKGLFRALCPDPAPEAVLADAPGWKLPETSLKPYPCCRHVHAAVDAALEVAARLAGRTPEGPVRVAVYPVALDVTDRPDPRTPHEARFSLQWAVATALVRGRPGLDAFSAEALADPEVRGVLARVEVGADPGIAAAYPARWGARVEVEDGAGDRGAAHRSDATGDPEAPLDDEALDAKVTGLLRWAGMGDTLARALLAACRALPDDGPLPALPDDAPSSTLPAPGAGAGGRP